MIKICSKFLSKIKNASYTGTDEKKLTRKYEKILKEKAAKLLIKFGRYLY